MEWYRSNRVLSGTDRGGVIQGYTPIHSSLQLYLIQVIVIVILCFFLGQLVKRWNQPRVIAEVGVRPRPRSEERTWGIIRGRRWTRQQVHLKIDGREAVPILKKQGIDLSLVLPKKARLCPAYIDQPCLHSNT